MYTSRFKSVMYPKDPHQERINKRLIEIANRAEHDKAFAHSPQEAEEIANHAEKESDAVIWHGADDD